MIKNHNLRLRWYREFDREKKEYINYRLNLVKIYGPINVCMDVDLCVDGHCCHLQINAIVNGQSLGLYDSAWDAEKAIIKKIRSDFRHCLRQIDKALARRRGGR